MGALCAITAKDNDAESAMLASWISQVRAYCVCAWCVRRTKIASCQQVLQHEVTPLHYYCRQVQGV